MLKGKTVLLGITGSIAAYKIAYLASALKKLHADVHVLMTENATNFINPITFETLTGNKCLVDTFDRNFQFQVEHVSIAKKADVVMIAPASANVIGKIANGLADGAKGLGNIERSRRALGWKVTKRRHPSHSCQTAFAKPGRTAASRHHPNRTPA